MAMKSNHLLFVGSYASEDDPGIYAYTFNSDTGQMASQGAYTGIKNPSFLTVHPNGKWIYAVSETSQSGEGVYGSVWAFSFQSEPMEIRPINQRSTDGDWPCHVALDATGRWLIASNYGSGNAALYPILADGGLGELQAFVQHEGQGPNAARQEGPHAHSAIFTPDNRHLIVADLGIDQLVIYKFDAEAGGLSQHAAVRTNPGAGPRHLVFYPDGQHMLAANELDNTVTAYRYEAAAGLLHAVQTVETLPLDAPENTVADIHISPTGEFVYVSNRGHNSLAVFAVSADRRLTRRAISPCGGNWPRNFALSPGGAYVLVANRFSNQISVLPVQGGSGELGEAAWQVEVELPSCVRFVD